MNRYFEAMMGFNPAALVCGLQHGPRALARASRAACLASRPAVKSPDDLVREQLEQVPVVHLDALMGDEKCQIKLRVMKYEDGMMPFRDALGLLSVLVATKPCQILEIGTYMGHTTLAMAENLETATIHTVDLPPDFSAGVDVSGLPPKDDFHLIARRIVGREFKGQPYENRIIQHFGDTAVMNFSLIGRPTSSSSMDRTPTSIARTIQKNVWHFARTVPRFSGMIVTRRIPASSSSY